MGKFSEVKKLLKGTAALAGVGAVIASPEDAEAGILNRKMLGQIIANLQKGGKAVTREELAAALELTPNMLDGSNQIKRQEALGHILMEKHGLSEDALNPESFFQTTYPESQKLDRVLIGSANEVTKPVSTEFQKQLGITPRSLPADVMGQLSEYALKGSVTPHSIVINKDTTESPIQLAGLIAHEGHHLRDRLLTPKESGAASAHLLTDSGKLVGSEDSPLLMSRIVNADPAFKKQLLESMIEADPKNADLKKIIETNPELNWVDLSRLRKRPGFLEAYYQNKLLTPTTAADIITRQHHVEYPKNFEIDRAVALLNKTNVEPSYELMSKQADDLRAEFLDTFNKNKKTAAVAPMGLLAADSDSPEFTSPLEYIKKGAGKVSEGIEYVDKKISNPARAAIRAALKVQNPIAAAQENEPTEGRELAKALYERISPELKVGKKTYLKAGEALENMEGVGGLGAELLVDPTNAVPLARFGKLKKLLKAIK